MWPAAARRLLCELADVRSLMALYATCRAFHELVPALERWEAPRRAILGWATDPGWSAFDLVRRVREMGAARPSMWPGSRSAVLQRVASGQESVLDLSYRRVDRHMARAAATALALGGGRGTTLVLDSTGLEDAAARELVAGLRAGQVGLLSLRGNDGLSEAVVAELRAAAAEADPPGEVVAGG